VTLYCDENVSPTLVKGLSILQDRLADDDRLNLKIVSLIDTFGRGALDEDWNPKIGKEKALALTHDINIKRRRQQFALLANHDVGIIFIKRPSKKSRYWDTVLQVVRAWPEVRRLIKINKKTTEIRIEIPASGKPKIV